MSIWTGVLNARIVSSCGRRVGGVSSTLPSGVALAQGTPSAGTAPASPPAASPTTAPEAKAPETAPAESTAPRKKSASKKKQAGQDDPAAGDRPFGRPRHGTGALSQLGAEGISSIHSVRKTVGRRRLSQRRVVPQGVRDTRKRYTQRLVAPYSIRIGCARTRASITAALAAGGRAFVHHDGRVPLEATRPGLLGTPGLVYSSIASAGPGVCARRPASAFMRHSAARRADFGACWMPAAGHQRRVIKIAMISTDF